MEELLPGLPDDVSMLCLGKLAYQSHASMQGVCRKWKELINDPLFYKYRCKQGFTAKGLCVVESIRGNSATQKLEFQKDAWLSLPQFQLCMLDSKKEARLWLPPIPDFPESLPFFCQCAFVNGDLFVMGGWNPDTYETISSVYAFNFSSGSWRRAANMINPRSFFACGVLEGCIVVAGGHDADKNAVSSAEIYDPSRNLWKNLPEMSQERDEAKGVVLDGKFYVFGGCPSRDEAGFARSADVFDLKQGCWAKMEEVWIEGAVPATAFVWKGRLLGFKGQSLMGFDPVKKKWSIVDSTPNGGEAICVNVLGEELVVMVRSGSHCNIFVYKESLHQKEKSCHWNMILQDSHFSHLPQFSCSVEI